MNRDFKWRPSIHMPKWAARLFLLVTAVQAQRVQDISEEDALAEGIQRSDWEYSCEPYRNYQEPVMAPGKNCATARKSFATLWDSIYADATVHVEVSEGVYETRSANLSWNDNPWVFAYKFEVTDKPEGWG
jgi:hypothetical protein